MSEKQKAYDPRDREQKLHDRSTWKETENLALIKASKKAWWRPDYWKGVAMLADLWDEEQRDQTPRDTP
ncbi:hypothetical protein [Chelativorans sp. AA-79]|uniref:hypothetical protein n=1 Tax=Chelativorans sp. AA-79 TaxID=3028735 RepID=UPI0023F873EF|nr:hypothetical protein [Chelativorans sp. AA-79]WEX10291.1 hypothetical protein PVE73_04850 [Chelativorans sp. AA-79]